VISASNTANHPITKAIIETRPGRSPVPASRRCATNATTATMLARTNVLAIARVSRSPVSSVFLVPFGHFRQREIEIHLDPVRVAHVYLVLIRQRSFY
jgi:hypothetical protein